MKDPFADDNLPTLSMQTIFQELDSASPTVSWRIYYSLTEGGCNEIDGDCGNLSNPSLYPVTSFSDFLPTPANTSITILPEQPAFLRRSVRDRR